MKKNSTRNNGGNDRSCRSQMFFKIGVLRNFSTRCFLVKFAKFLRIGVAVKTFCLEMKSLGFHLKVWLIIWRFKKFFLILVISTDFPCISSEHGYKDLLTRVKNWSYSNIVILYTIQTESSRRTRIQTF